MYQVGDACYPTMTAAAQVSASAQVGAVVSHGTVSYVVNATAVDDVSITYTFNPVGGGTPLTITSPYTAQPCGLLTIEDGLQIGWMVVAAWLGAFALLFITRALRGETGGEYGNS